MRQSTMTSLLRGAVCAGLIAFPLLAADGAAQDSSSFSFWALILGLLFTMFGGMAFCYGLVKLGEYVVSRFQATHHAAPGSEPPLRRAA
jgi:hypothetical protein